MIRCLRLFSGRHFGSRLVFDRAGFRYITLGDRGEMERAQKPDDHAGSVIRLHDGGRVPKDNRFVGGLNRWLVRLKLDAEKVLREERVLRGELGSIRDVRMGPDGSLYLLTDDSNGFLARLDPAN